MFISFCVSHSLTDTAAKLAATKAVAADANATAIDVLERLGDLNLRLGGLQRNYSELEDTVNAANQMIQDPEKNSKVLYYWVFALSGNIRKVSLAGTSRHVFFMTHLECTGFLFNLVNKYLQ